MTGVIMCVPTPVTYGRDYKVSLFLHLFFVLAAHWLSIPCHRLPDVRLLMTSTKMRYHSTTHQEPELGPSVARVRMHYASVVFLVFSVYQQKPSKGSEVTAQLHSTKLPRYETQPSTVSNRNRRPDRSLQGKVRSLGLTSE